MITPTHDSPLARIARRLNPDHGWCGRCGCPWTIVSYHITNYTPGSGCFPLCTSCWALLTAAERWPYYESLISEWRDGIFAISDDDYAALRAAVEAGA